MKRFLILSSLFLLISNSTFANFREGYIITHENDTVFGQVDYRSNLKNYKSCRFKFENEIIEYLPQQILGFGYSEDKCFTSNIIEGAFVEILVHGKLSLYKLNDKFIAEKGGEIYSLETKEIEILVDGKKGLKKDDKWKGIVTVLINDCSYLFRDAANQIDFGEKGITEIVIKYNECRKSEFVVYKNKKQWTRFEYGVNIGVSYSNIKVNPESRYNYLDNSYSSIDPTIGFLLAISSPRVSERFAFQSELNFTKSTYTSLVEINRLLLTEYHDVNLSITTLSIPFSLRYSLPVNRISIQGLVGVNYNYNITSSSKLQSEFITNNVVNTLNERPAFDVNKSQVGLWGGLGVQRSFQKFNGSIFLRYSVISDLISSNDIIANTNTLSLSLIFSAR